MSTNSKNRGRSNKIAQAPISSPPPPTFTQTPSFFSTMTQGMALGAGSSMGHRAIDALFGSSPRVVVSETQTIVTPECKPEFHVLIECIKSEDNECHNFHESFIECQKKTK